MKTMRKVHISGLLAIAIVVLITSTNSAQAQTDPLNKYFVSWFAMDYKNEKGVSGYCRCYIFAKTPRYFMPSPQFTGLSSSPSGPFTFQDAAAWVQTYAISDPGTCPRNNCSFGALGGGGTGTDHPPAVDPPNDQRSDEECKNQFCPMCRNSVVLLGQAVSPECQSCLDRHTIQIQKCFRANAGSNGNLPPLTSTLVGRWRWFTGSTVTINGNGTATSSAGSRGTWTRIGNKFIFKWTTKKGNHYKDELELSDDGRRISGKNQMGTKISAERIE